jgi:hypothetical protein
MILSFQMLMSLLACFLAANNATSIKGPYAAVAFEDAAPTTPVVHPLYYGLLAFTELTANAATWLPVSLNVHPSHLILRNVC